jgi:hypothetical protein
LADSKSKLDKTAHNKRNPESNANRADTSVNNLPNTAILKHQQRKLKYRPY